MWQALFCSKDTDVNKIPTPFNSHSSGWKKTKNIYISRYSNGYGKKKMKQRSNTRKVIGRGAI